MKNAYRNLSDQELVDLFNQSNRDAIGAIYSRYFDRLIFHAFKILNDQSQAEDIVQDFFSKLLLSTMGTYQINTSLAGYLHRSVRNMCLDLIRRGKTNENLKISYEEHVQYNIFSLNTSLQDKELAQLIEQEIANLPPKMREVFEMSRNSDLTHKDIAAKIGIEPKTVNKHISKAVKRLWDRLSIRLLISLISSILMINKFNS